MYENNDTLKQTKDAAEMLEEFFKSENTPDDDAWMLQCAQAMALTAIAQELHELNKRVEALKS